MKNENKTAALESQVGGNHYKKLGDYQPWEVLRRWLTREEFRGYMKGQAIAYLARERDKGGDQDIAKAEHYLRGLLELGAMVEAENPASLPVSAGTIDTPALDKLLGDFRAAMDIDTKNRAVSAIHQHVAAAVAEARKETRDYYEAKIADLFGAATAPVSAVPIDERAEFEKSRIAHVQGYSYGRHLPCLDRTGEGYEHPFVHYAWMGWKARASLPPSAGAPVSAAEAREQAIEECASIVDQAREGDRRRDTAAKIRSLAAKQAGKEPK